MGENLRSFYFPWSSSLLVWWSMSPSVCGPLAGWRFQSPWPNWCQVPFHPSAWQMLNLIPADRRSSCRTEKSRRISAEVDQAFGKSISHGFQALFGIYTSWLLLCIRIPPEKDWTIWTQWAFWWFLKRKNLGWTECLMLRCHLRLSKFVEVKIPAQDAFDEEYMTDDDEECRLKVRDVCAMRAKNVGSMEVIVRALSLCGLHYWLICAGRYSDLFFLDFLYITYAWLVCTVASSVPETVEVAMYIDYIVNRMHPIYIYIYR